MGSAVSPPNWSTRFATTDRPCGAFDTGSRATRPAERGHVMKVVLFCGGLGMRMRADNQSLPKPMTPIGSRPVLWHVMRYYAHFGHKDFILCLGHGAGRQGLL